MLDRRRLNAAGHGRLVNLKHGTEVADGSWAEVKSSYPSQVKSTDHERLSEYIGAWAWKARRHGYDIFQVLGASL